MGADVSFQQMDDATSPQASGMTLVHYFKLLRGLVATQLYCPAPYRDLLERLCGALGVQTTFRELGEAVEGSFHECSQGLGKPRALWRTGTSASTPDPVWLDFPLREDGWEQAFQQARARGYRFAALVPLTVDGPFHLRLQKPPTGMDWDGLQLHHPLARELRDFLRQEAP